jgi:hypothetical protein
VSTTFKRAVSMLAVMVMGVVVPFAAARADQATTTAGIAHISVNGGSGSKSVQPNDLVTCTLQVDNVVLYGPSAVSGSGRIVACIPHNPQTCRTQAFVQEYTTYGWQNVGTGTVGLGCPGQSGTGSIAVYNCTSTTSTVEYRTALLETIIEDNNPAVGAYYSPGVSYFHCA